MHKTLIDDLQKEADSLELQITDLTKKKDALLNVISEFGGIPGFGSRAPGIEEYPDNEVKVKIKEVKSSGKKETAKAKDLPAGKKGTMKFAAYLINYFESHQGNSYTSKEITNVMEKAISGGKIFPIPTKDLVSNVSAYLWYYAVKDGRLSKQEDNGVFVYQYQEKPAKVKKEKPAKKQTPKEIKEKSSDQTDQSDRSDLEEVILDVIREEKRITLPALVNKIRLSEDFGQISKNLNGTLSGSVEKILKSLTDVKVLEWNSDNEYCINPKTGL